MLRKKLHHLLLACALFWAQAFALVHAMEHIGSDALEAAPHVCSLCLSTHDLGSTVGAAFALPIAPAAHEAPAAWLAPARLSLSAPEPRQQSPPLL